MNRFKIAILISIGLNSGCPIEARATENGFSAYPQGVNTILNGLVPQPGQTWIQNYSTYYSAKSFKDSNGNNLIPGFDADLAVESIRVMHTWDWQIGQFSVSSTIVLPFIHADIDTAFGGTDNTEIGDVSVGPMYLGWSNPDKTFFAYAGLEFYLPSKTEVSNKVFSISPNLHLTWLPDPQLELSGTIGTEFHLKNEDTDYQSGSLSYMDWAVNYRAFQSLPQLAIGVQGYAAKQFSDDKIGGTTVSDGFRQQAFAIGPQLVYAIGNRGGGVVLKWQHEFDVENRPEGDKFWFQFQVPIGN
ncbi:transporter [Phyllobacterium sp. YR531]|uniref:SphA family protein n=1 Tax=Phyllobacterium sp. YR531 TaxID=1144343 RepID=UPI00026FBA88|nr:transporter [Phyllobacterium sp. YR531]EJN05858.1 protein involved in meta-pathway of phenol degradation [Phyllobacterium sp. YR531]